MTVGFRIFQQLVHLWTSVKLVRYLFAGSIGAMVHVGTVFVCTHMFDIWYRVSTIIGFFLSVSVSFYLQKHWTFREHEISHAGKQFLQFVSIGGINFVLNISIMILMVEVLHLWPVAAQILTSGIVAVESFLLYSLIFRTVERRAVTSLGSND